MEKDNKEVIIQYNWDTEFDKAENLFLSTLSSQKEVCRKITNKLVQKLITEMLNNNITPEYVAWYKEAMRHFNNIIK